ncbi:MAG: ABC transporter ATP-binding protein [Nitriliruptorales bacterium]|nr:ABC transporter ATP-binding protein [Nitriliruptorales bacterium]
MIAVRGLRKSFGSRDARVVALDGVQLDVEPGEFLAVTGPSGSGKTTLLHCVAGVLVPDDGTVVVDGVEVTAQDEDARADLRRRRMGFVLQRLNLLPQLTAAENVQLPLVLRGDSRREIETRTAEVLDRVGLSGRGDAMPSELSGGQVQRVAVARAIASNPDILLADEPTGQLDSEHAAGLADTFASLADDGVTVVLVTHDLDVAGRADRRVRLVDGHLDES